MMIVTNALAYYISYDCKSFIVQVTTALMSKNIWDTKNRGSTTLGIQTLSITTFSITTFNITVLSLTTFSIATFSIVTLSMTIFSIVKVIVMTFSIMALNKTVFILMTFNKNTRHSSITTFSIATASMWFCIMAVCITVNDTLHNNPQNDVHYCDSHQNTTFYFVS